MYGIFDNRIYWGTPMLITYYTVNNRVIFGRNIRVVQLNQAPVIRWTPIVLQEIPLVNRGILPIVDEPAPQEDNESDSEDNHRRHTAHRREL